MKPTVQFDSFGPLSHFVRWPSSNNDFSSSLMPLKHAWKDSAYSSYASIDGVFHEGLSVASKLRIHAMIEEQLEDWLVDPLAIHASIKHAPIAGDREVALRPHTEVLWDRHTHRVQVAVDASPHIILLNIELVALKVDLATHGIDARLEQWKAQKESCAPWQT